MENRELRLGLELTIFQRNAMHLLPTSAGGLSLSFFSCKKRDQMPS